MSLGWAAGAVLLAGLAGLTVAEVEAENAAYARALAAEPPAAVAIERLGEGAVGDGPGELVLTAQVDTARAARITLGRGADVTIAVVLPLHAVGAMPGSPALGAIVESDGRLRGAELDRWWIGQGRIGPVMELHGRARPGAGAFEPAILGQFAESGVSLAPNAVFLDPYREGREAALSVWKSPTAAAAPWLLAALVTAVLAGLARFVAGRRRTGPGRPPSPPPRGRRRAPGRLA